MLEKLSRVPCKLTVARVILEYLTSLPTTKFLAILLQITVTAL